MSRLKLIRATPENGLFSDLEEEWGLQLRHEDAPTDYYAPMMEHAKRISEEHPQDTKYGIFLLVRDKGNGHISCYEGMVHVNHAWPKSKDATLRLVWNLIAPRYQYEDVPPVQMARIMTAFLTESLVLCDSDMKSREVKMYLNNAVDREYAAVAAGFMEQNYPQFAFAIRGSWLHISTNAVEGGSHAG